MQITVSKGKKYGQTKRDKVSELQNQTTSLTLPMSERKACSVVLAPETRHSSKRLHSVVTNTAGRENCYSSTKLNLSSFWTEVEKRKHYLE